uniref:Uncharacterized protein n=1 Tax=Rhizophora mucronata TaxID=61149 RepID=A0A2P2KAU9_RHIMU
MTLGKALSSGYEQKKLGTRTAGSHFEFSDFLRL